MLDKPLLIYLVDDDKEDRTLFIEALDEIDIHVRVEDFDNGVTLMDNLLNTNNPLPGAIFLDLNMPLMNGEECVDDIRNEPQFAQIPIIIYSTHADEFVVRKLLEKGANWYLIKPDSFDKLKKLLIKSLIHIYQHDARNKFSYDEFVITAT